MAPRNQFLRLENRIAVCREYAELWQEFFQFFSDDFEEKGITEQMENEFENTMSVLALNHFKFQELCGDYMKDSQAILSILSDAVSLQVIRDMTESSRSKLMVEWHTTFIEMNKALGKMLGQLTPKQLEAMQAAAGAPAPQQKG